MDGAVTPISETQTELEGTKRTIPRLEQTGKELEEAIDARKKANERVEAARVTHTAAMEEEDVEAYNFQCVIGGKRKNVAHRLEDGPKKLYRRTSKATEPGGNE